MRSAMAFWSLLLAGPMSLSAQQETDSVVTERVDTIGIRQTGSTAAETLFLAGIAGMGTGAFGGGLVGTEIDNDGGLDDAEGAIVGALAGTTLLIPTAVHLANHSRGNLGRSILVSTLFGGAFLGLGLVSGHGEIVVAIPFVQVFVAMAVERDTSKRR
jgi:hypothetical protein